MQAAEWVIWLALAFFTLTWTYGVIKSLKAGGISGGMVGTVASWWIQLVGILLVPSISKLHLLWMAPSALLLANFLPLFILTMSH